jgi:hypothetical protein
MSFGVKMKGKLTVLSMNSLKLCSCEIGEQSSNGKRGFGRWLRLFYTSLFITTPPSIPSSFIAYSWVYITEEENPSSHLQKLFGNSISTKKSTSPET